MQKLTKAEAIANHRKMWRWIAEETKKQGRIVAKINYFDEMGVVKKNRPLFNCYCCEYARQPRRNCDHCPIEWPTGDCENDGGLYDLWLDAADPAEAARLARQIAELPEREE